MFFVLQINFLKEFLKSTITLGASDIRSPVKHLVKCFTYVEKGVANAGLFPPVKQVCCMRSFIFSLTVNSHFSKPNHCLFCECGRKTTPSGPSYQASIYTQSYYCTPIFSCCLRQHGSVVCVQAGGDGSLFAELNKD